MAQIGTKNPDWQDGEPWESTADPGISVAAMTENVPTLTVATIIVVTFIVLIAIAVVFLLGVLIDCRQQRLLEKKMGVVKRIKNHRRGNSHPDGDGISISNNMEATGVSTPPASELRDIP